MEEKTKINDYSDLNDFFQDYSFMLKLYEGKLEAYSLYEKASLKSGVQKKTKKQKLEKVKPRIDPLIQNYLDSEDILLEKISSGNENFMKELKNYQESTINLLAKKDNRIFRKRILTENQAKMMVLYAKAWKKKYPTSKGIPKEILLRGKPPTHIVIGSMHEKQANPYQKLVLRGKITKAPYPIFPFVPKLEFLRSGVHEEIEHENLQVIPNCGSLPGYWEDWFEFNPGRSGWSGASTRVTVRNDLKKGWLNVYFDFVTIIEVKEEDNLALHVKSRAAIYSGSNEDHPPWAALHPVIEYHVSYIHSVLVECQKTEQDDLLLSPDPWHELVYSQKYINHTYFKDYPFVDRLGVIEEMGPNAEPPDPSNNGEVFEWPGGEEVGDPPYYVRGNGGLTTLDGDYPKISLFRGPCKIKITQRIMFWHFINSTQRGKGEHHMDNSLGYLEPLNWSLFKVVEWVPC